MTISEETTLVASPPLEPQTWYQLAYEILKRVLFSPSRFFSEMPSQGGTGYALTFALLVHWIGTLANFFWENLFGTDWEDAIKQFQKYSGQTGSLDILEKIKEPNVQLFLKLGPVLADPLILAFKISTAAVIIYVAIRLLVDAGKDGAPREHRLETVLKIQSYSYLAGIFLVIPFIGNFIAYVWGFIILVQGIKKVYHVSTMRSLVIVSFPALLLAGLLFVGLFAFFVLGFKLLGSFF